MAIRCRSRSNCEESRSVSPSFLGRLGGTADSHQREFNLAFGWFAARRAQSIGLPPGCFVVTLPADCPREHLSWRLEAAEFMEQEQRAAQIERAQSGTSMYSRLTGDESLRSHMPPAEGRCQSGASGPSERLVGITVGQFMQLQTGSTILQEPLQYELQEFR
jgi:hypothetical protein